MPLYDKALIGGADHIMAHAAAGQIPHECITKSFTDNLKEVETWSREFYAVMQGRIGFVEGTLYHLWHGDIEKRQYLKRIKDFTKETKQITQKDSNGLYVKTDNNAYMEQYYRQREAITTYEEDFQVYDPDFYRDMGYTLQSFIDQYLRPMLRNTVFEDVPIQTGVNQASDLSQQSIAHPGTNPEYSDSSAGDMKPSASDLFVTPVSIPANPEDLFTRPSEPVPANPSDLFEVNPEVTHSNLSEQFERPIEVPKSNFSEMFSRSEVETTGRETSENFS
jgi:hypothetical protein